MFPSCLLLLGALYGMYATVISVRMNTNTHDIMRFYSWNTQNNMCLLLLFWFLFCPAGIQADELTQPASVVIQPGQQLTIDCKVSYSLTSYDTAWVRQPAGKPLEWINIIWSGGSTANKDSLKNKFSVSRDTSSKTVTLRGQNMQPEDTAVYYCARSPQWYNKPHANTKSFWSVCASENNYHQLATIWGKDFH